MEMPDFDFEFYVDIAALTPESINELRAEAESRLRQLAAGHTDMIGATVNMERMASGETPHTYRAQVVAYIRPDNLAGQARGDDLLATLREAIAAVERQVRERRTQFRKRSRR